MSGSKYCEMQVEQERLAEQRRREKEEHERRQRERQLLEAQMRLEAARNTAAVTLATCEAALAGVSIVGERIVGAGTVNGLRRRVADVAQRLSRAADESAVRAESSTLERLQSEVTELVGSASRAVEQHSLMQGEVASMEVSLVNSTGILRRLLNGEDCVEVRKQIATLRSQLAQVGSSEDLIALRNRARLIRSEFAQREGELVGLAKATERSIQMLERSRSAWNTLTNGQVGSHVDAATLGSVAAELASVSDLLQGVESAGMVTHAQSQMAQLQSRIQREISAAEAACRSANLDAEARGLAVLQGQIETIDVRSSEKFDSDGRKSTLELIGQCERQLNAGNLETGRDILANARTSFKNHLSTVESKESNWKRSQSEAHRSLGSLSTRIEQLGSDEKYTSWLPATFGEMRSRMDALHRDFESENFDAVVSSAAQLEVHLAPIITEVQQLVGLSDQINEFQLGLSRLREATGHEFDITGHARVASFLSAAVLNLKKRNTERCRQSLIEAETSLQAHRSKVDSDFSAWQEHRENARQAVLIAREKLLSVMDDTSVASWITEDLEKVQQNVESGECCVEQGRFKEAFNVVAGVAAKLDQLVKSVEPLREQAARQKYIADGIAEVMQRMSFELVRGDEEPGNPKTAIIIRAAKDVGEIDRAAITVAVEQNGRVEYEIGGALHKKQFVDVKTNQPVSTCDEGAQQIRRIHDLLREIGIDADELKWDGKPDRPDSEAAMDAPFVAGQVQPRTMTKK